jgi:tetratricopeptide (TPR) repeat protein
VTNKPAIKIALYVLLSLGLIVFFSLFTRELARGGQREIVDMGEDAAPDSGRSPAPARNHSVLYLGLVIACAVPLGLLIAKDVSALAGQQALDLIFNDDGDGIHNADYDAAETEVTRGNVLEAINMMRACYEKSPREVYIAIRIAELYEVNLRNHLAAALEYEEIIKKKLPPERWGWAAIHLANLYSGKLNRTDDAMALLQRIVAEVPKTAAAKKARDRLGLPEDAPAPEFVPGTAPHAATVNAGAALPSGFAPKGSRDHAAPASETAEPVEPEPEVASATALPAGFRPRSNDEDTTFIAPASETMEPASRPDRPAAPAAAPNLPPGFRPKG